MTVKSDVSQLSALFFLRHKMAEIPYCNKPRRERSSFTTRTNYNIATYVLFCTLQPSTCVIAIPGAGLAFKIHIPG